MTAVGFGLVAGWAELAAFLLSRAIDPRVSMASLRTNRFALWMIPVTAVFLFAAVGLVLAVLARWKPAVVRALAGRLFLGLSALGLLTTVEGLHPLAMGVLAAGVGWRCGAWVNLWAERRPVAVRRGIVAMAVALVGWTASVHAIVATSEARALAALPPAPGRAPNVVLLVLDNVRAASLSLHGHDRPTSPNLDRLARRGVWFDHARSAAPWTLPSHATMFTGQWSHALSVGFDRPLDTSEPTLAGHLAGRGYACAGFVGNTYYCNARFGLDRGFARYDDLYENRTTSPAEMLRNSGLGRLLLTAVGSKFRIDEGGCQRKSAEMLNRDALGWIDARPADRPFFVFINYYDAHGPFIAPEGPDPRFGLGALPLEERSKLLSRFERVTSGKARPSDGPPEQAVNEACAVMRDSYESCIAYLDRQVGAFVGELERRGLLEDTLLVVTSDHGEQFMEHGFFGHGLSVYRDEVHVPLVVLAPSGVGAGTVVDAPVSLQDLAATCVDVLGVAAGAPFPGASLARHWRRPDREGPPARFDPVVVQTEHRSALPPTSFIPATLGAVRSVVSEGKVYIRTGARNEELYDLHGDPGEAVNLANTPNLSPSLDYFRDLLDRCLNEPATPGR